MENNINQNNSQNFTVEKKGYKIEEVDNFVNQQSTALEKKMEKIYELEYEISEINSKLNDYYDIDKKLRDKLLNLTESEKETLDRANEKAQDIIENAEKESRKIVKHAEEIVKATRDTLIFLKEQQEILLARIKIIIDNQDAMLLDFKKGDNSQELQKTIAEAAAFKVQTEMNIDSILEKLL